MDMSKLCTAEAHENGAELTILDPIDYTKTDFIITLKGLDSRSFRFKNKANIRKGIALLQDGEKPSNEDLDDLDIETMAECTIGWTGLYDGETEIVFSKEKAIEIYKAAPAVREQVERFVKDRENFTQG